MLYFIQFSVKGFNNCYILLSISLRPLKTLSLSQVRFPLCRLHLTVLSHGAFIGRIAEKTRKRNLVEQINTNKSRHGELIEMLLDLCIKIIVLIVYTILCLFGSRPIKHFCAKIRSISISSPCHFYFVLYCFIRFSFPCFFPYQSS